jgi:hypothetical protein
MFSSSLLIWKLVVVAVLASRGALAGRPSKKHYQLIDNYEGVGFFDKFNFFTVCSAHLPARDAVGMLIDC